MEKIWHLLSSICTRHGSLSELEVVRLKLNKGFGPEHAKKFIRMSYEMAMRIMMMIMMMMMVMTTMMMKMSSRYDEDKMKMVRHSDGNAFFDVV